MSGLGVCPRLCWLLGGKGLERHHWQKPSANACYAVTLENMRAVNAPVAVCLRQKTHPDFLRIEPVETGKIIPVDTIRGLIANLALKPQYRGRRVVLISPAHQMNVSSANSLLKTLEEPDEHTTLLLLTDSPHIFARDYSEPMSTHGHHRSGTCNGTGMAGEKWAWRRECRCFAGFGAWRTDQSLGAGK